MKTFRQHLNEIDRGYTSGKDGHLELKDDYDDEGNYTLQNKHTKEPVFTIRHYPEYDDGEGIEHESYALHWHPYMRDQHPELPQHALRSAAGDDFNRLYHDAETIYHLRGRKGFKFPEKK